jgi:hypothetical protein
VGEANNWVGNLGTLEIKPESEKVVAQVTAVAEPVATVEAVAVEKPVDDVGLNSVKTVEPEKEDTVEAKMVPQEILGKVLKAQREKFKSRENGLEERLKALEDENKRLKEGGYQAEPDENEALIAKKVKEEFLTRQDAYGREKYGQQYADALELVAMQNDPILVNKIQMAATPADTLIVEAIRIAEELEFGATPLEREKKKEAMLKEKLKKELEAELAEKIKAKVNQTTDVQSVRSAGGDVRPIQTRETWSSGRGSLPR